MEKLIFLLLCFFVLVTSSHGYESENKLEILIISKVSKFIKWEDKPYENFLITILNNPYGNLFEETLAGKKINGKNVKLVYIDDISQLQDTNILYISQSDAKELENVLTSAQNKNIVTISGIRGFAEKDGVMQIYFVSQKAKLKINLDVAKNENLKISSSLLRISDVVRK